VKKTVSFMAVMAILAALGGAACSSQKSADQQKVQELQAQLDQTKKELAAKQEQAAAAETTPAEPQPAAPPPAEAPPAVAPAKPQAAKPAGAKKAAAKPATPAAQQYVTAEQGAKASEQYAQDKAKVKGAFEEQAQTNDQVQQQIHELKSRDYTIPAGTVIAVRNTTELSTSKLANGSVFEAVLEQPLVVSGTVLAPQGAPVTGVVVLSDPGGRVKGVASMDVTIRSIAGARNNTIRVTAGNYGVEAGTSKGRDAKRTGVMAGAGALVGAIAGGGKGAAIGLGAGAAAGVGTNMATKGKAAVIPAETLMEFTLTGPTTVTFRQ
jgi:hypothetical protein